MTHEQRQELIEYIEAHIGTLASMPWDKISDDDLKRIVTYIDYK